MKYFKRNHSFEMRNKTKTEFKIKTSFYLKMPKYQNLDTPNSIDILLFLSMS